MKYTNQQLLPVIENSKLGSLELNSAKKTWLIKMV
jgi:hypothetical protein